MSETTFEQSSSPAAGPKKDPSTRDMPDPKLTYEKHKNIMVFNGYQFSACRTFVTKSGVRKFYWRCLECKKSGCKGTLATVNVDGQLQIVRDSATKHSHPPDFLAVDKRKYIGLVKKHHAEHPYMNAKSIYDHFLPTMSPEMLNLYPDAPSIKPLLRKRKLKEGEEEEVETLPNGEIKRPKRDCEVRLYDPMSYAPGAPTPPPVALPVPVPAPAPVHVPAPNNNYHSFPDPTCELYEPMMDSGSSLCHTPPARISPTKQAPRHSMVTNHQPSPVIAPPPMHRQGLALPLNGTVNLVDWGVEHVSYFLTCNGFQMLAPIFEENQINGIAFAEMEKSDLVQLLKIKVGHAVQVFKLIKQIREIFNYES